VRWDHRNYSVGASQTSYVQRQYAALIFEQYNPSRCRGRRFRVAGQLRRRAAGAARVSWSGPRRWCGYRGACGPLWRLGTQKADARLEGKDAIDGGVDAPLSHVAALHSAARVGEEVILVRNHRLHDVCCALSRGVGAAAVRQGRMPPSRLTASATAEGHARRAQRPAQGSTLSGVGDADDGRHAGHDAFVYGTAQKELQGQYPRKRNFMGKSERRKQRHTMSMEERCRACTTASRLLAADLCQSIWL
jgi:hypothetical protein